MKRIAFNSWVSNWILEDRIINDSTRTFGMRQDDGFRDLYVMSLKHDTLKTIDIVYYKKCDKYYFVHANYSSENWKTHGFRTSLTKLITAMYADDV